MSNPCYFVNCNFIFLPYGFPFNCPESTQEPQCNCGCCLPFPCDKYIFTKAISVPKKKRKSPKTESGVPASRKRKAIDVYQNMNGYCHVKRKYYAKLIDFCTHPECQMA